MKRSKRLVLTSLMAGTGVSLSACGGDTAPTQWGDPPAATASAETDAVDAQEFTTLADCRVAGDFTPEQCETAYAAAQAEHTKSAPQFNDRPTCEEQFGVGQCEPRNNGSFFTPLLTGFIVGQALSNIGGGGGYFGRPYYRDRYGSSFLSNGRRLDRDYVSGRYRVGREVYAPPRAQAPTRVQSRSAVVSRGGFGGGGGRSRGG